MGIDAQMFVKLKLEPSPDELRAAEHKLFALFGPEEMDTWADSILAVVPTYEQDGPDIEPEEGEVFVEVNIWSRYYGPGYERGNFRLIHDVAEALECIFPDGSVFYGGDSSGVLAEPFDAEARGKMRRHWLTHAHKPYVRSMGTFMGATSKRPSCLRCREPMYQYGWGGSYAAFACECGEQVIRRAGVTTRTTYQERKTAKKPVDT